MTLPAIPTRQFDKAEALALLQLAGYVNEDTPSQQTTFSTNGWDWKAGFLQADGTKQPDLLDKKGKPIDPFDNGWALYQQQGSDSVFAIVVRGTRGNLESILADLLASSVNGTVQVTLGKSCVRFPVATTPQAEAHLGFSYALAVLLYDREYGILQALNTHMKQGGTLYITGHSQGAAIATLLHGFLAHALSGPQTTSYLPCSNFALKSYLFAQPKAGNWQFSLDYAHFTGIGTSYVVNNALDWVPQVPLSLERLAEPLSNLTEESQPGDPGVGEVLKIFAKAMDAACALVARGGQKVLDAEFTEYQEKHQRFDAGYFEAPQHIGAADSVNYWSCGVVVPVFGTPHEGGGYVHDGWMTQHHATTYLHLIETQL